MRHYQNQFIGNASHELQTPLAVCSGRIEMLLDSENLTGSQAEELVKISRTLQGMSKLNRTLLLMTKIDNGQFIDKVNVDICASVRESVQMLMEIYGHKGVDAEVRAEGRLDVLMNEQLSSILVSNLLKNAFMHSAPGTTVRVSVEDGVLTVSNAGKIPLDGERIFERFYQGSAKKEGSTGLGLALVKAICDRYSFRLAYGYSDGCHRFTVDFN